MKYQKITLLFVLLSALTTPLTAFIGAQPLTYAVLQNYSTHNFAPSQLNWRLIDNRLWSQQGRISDPAAFMAAILAQTTSTAATDNGCPQGMVRANGTYTNTEALTLRERQQGLRTVEEIQGQFCVEMGPGGERNGWHVCLRYDRTGYLNAITQLRERLNEAGRLRALDYCIDIYEFPNIPGEHPVVTATWIEANQYCHRLGKHLCSATEWQFACEGPEAWPYAKPDWDVRVPENDSERDHACDLRWAIAPQQTTRATTAQRPSARDQLGRYRRSSPEYGRLVAMLYGGYASGMRSNCHSYFGVYDMVGNVDEWTNADWSVRQIGNPRNLLNNSRLMRAPYASHLKGGWWSNVRNRCRPTTTAHGPGYSYYQSGFRCCADKQ